MPVFPEYAFLFRITAVLNALTSNYVMFKTRAEVFYRDLKPRGAAEWF